MADQRIEEITETMYLGYGNSVGWKTWNGGEMPTWPALPEKQKNGWRAAAHNALISFLHLQADMLLAESRRLIDGE